MFQVEIMILIRMIIEICQAKPDSLTTLHNILIHIGKIKKRAS